MSPTAVPPRAPPAIDRVLRDHADLRERLAEIEGLLARLESGTESATNGLRERGLSLYELLRAHIDREEQILAPAFRAQGSEGARRADALEQEHREQRELLGFLASRLAEPRRPPALIVRELRSFLVYLREDMGQEEALLGDGADDDASRG